MLIFIYGPDTYRSRQKLQKILTSYESNSSDITNFSCFDFSKTGELGERNKQTCFEDFERQAYNISLFEGKRIIILKNVFESEEFKKRLLAKAESLLTTQDIILIYEQGNVNKNDNFYKFLKKNAEIQEFEPLKGLKLKEWLKRELEKKGASITDQALEEIIACAKEDLWLLSNELQKFISFKNHQEITLEDIKMYSKFKTEADIFKTIEAISQKRKKQALQFLHGHLETGDSPFYVFSMINFQFRNLLIIKDLMEKGEFFDQILKKVPLHPLVIKKSYSQARRFSFQELKKIYQKLFQMDFQIKIGKIKAETALELFIAQI